MELAIASVVSQRREDCELIVVDDGSTDGSYERAKAMGVSAYRYENAGQRTACIRGVERTSAPFVLFLDADDELAPGSLGTIIDHLDPQVAKLQFPLRSIGSEGNPIGETAQDWPAYRESDRLQRQILRNGPDRTPPPSGNVFRRDVLELLHEASYDQTVDGIILFAAPFLGDVVSLAEPLGLYRIHDRNDSGLGRGQTVEILRSHLARFEARSAHLRRFLDERGLGKHLVAVEETFHHRELRFLICAMSGRRPPLRDTFGLISRLSREPHGTRRKISLGAFFLLAGLLTPSRSQRLVALRTKTGSRNLGEILGIIFSRR